MKQLIRFTLGVAIALAATVTMAPEAAYAAQHTHVILAPGGSSQTTITTPSSGTVTSNSGNGSGTFGTNGYASNTGNPPSGSGGGLSTPPSPGTPPQTTTVNWLVSQPTSGPPQPSCWYDSAAQLGGPYAHSVIMVLVCQGITVQACLNGSSVCANIDMPSCPSGSVPVGGVFKTSVGYQLGCKFSGTNPTSGYQTSWTIGVPGDGGTVCVTAWRVVFQGQTQTLTDGGNCYTSPPIVNYKYICGVQPTYNISAEVTAPGGSPLTIYSHFTQNGYSFTVTAENFPQWFPVSSGTMPGPASCPNSTWNSPPSGIKVTTTVAAGSGGGILPNGDIQALGEPIHIDYTPTLYGGHLILNTGVSCASLTTDEYYHKWLWVTGGGNTSLQYQRASNGKMYHLIDGMSVLPYNASITGDGTADGGQACQATLHIHGPTPPGAPYIVQADPQFTYTYGILHINLATTFAGLAAVSQQITGSGTFPENVPCTKHVDINGHKTVIHTTCLQDVTRTDSITFSTLQADSVSSVLTQTTNTHTVTIHSPQVNQNTFSAERPYIKSQSY